MNFRKPIFWQQGLFLQPQHLQYGDMRARQLSYDLHRQLAPHLWGVGALEVNEEALENGVFEVHSGNFLFQDGTHVFHPESAVLESRSFEQAWTDRNRPFRVFLGLPKLSAADANVAVGSDGQGGGTRFVAAAENTDGMPDLYQEGPRGEVQTLDHVLRILWDTEVQEEGGEGRYHLIPLAQLISDGDMIRVDPAFSPPCLSIGASAGLMRLLRGVRDDLVGRAHQLEAYKVSSDAVSSDSSPRYMRYLLALQAFGRHVPTLVHYLEEPAVHPWEAYRTLRQLVGELSIYSTQVDVTGASPDRSDGLPVYSHADPGASFSAAIRILQRAMNEITVGPEELIHFEPVGEGRFHGDIPEDFLDRRNTLYLVLRTEEDFEDHLEPFLRFAKLGAGDEVELFARRALPGVGLQHVQVRPEGLPYRPNATYFRVDRGGEAWSAVERRGELDLLWDEAPADLSIELLVVRG
ncbi:type VI secretion system baseplate subunit TssK [Thiohalorhabdus methylotrophus]|uniref:Type VI secretion system baseplate subunit TssK n=1 Tax=Thiohalorhabdus methylotrophus TaxID=3242694 RepID=A0ABV4TUK6_9GAMM